MKITRVLLAANDNPNYYQFWNPISRIYKEKFNVQPTLIWLGEAPDIERLGLSSEFGNILIRKPHPKHHIGWQCAWAIFWHMKFYPDDTFVTMGIDQVPLSKLLLKFVPQSHSDETYLMLADDGYLPSHWSDVGGTSPTSFHIVRGDVACKIYGFEESFHDELDKMAASGIAPYYASGDSNWGLDESYSSHKLRQYRDSGGKVVSESIFDLIRERRIECCRDKEVDYDKEMLRMGFYGDAHLCRPFSNHKAYIETILSLIPSGKCST